MSDIDLKDVAIIGALAGGGILLYKTVKNSGTSTYTPSENWESVNKLIESMKDSNSDTMRSLLEILNIQRNNSDGSSGSSDGGGSSTITPTTPTTPEDGDGSANIDDTKDLLKLTTTALNKLGYNGVQLALRTEILEENDRMMEEAHDAVKVVQNVTSNDTERDLNKAITGNPDHKLGLDPMKLVRPSTYVDMYNSLKTGFDYLGDLISGQKHNDDPLSLF